VSDDLDPGRGLAAALLACGVADRSAQTRLLATGPDILDLIHRLSTGDVKTLGEGEGRPTVLTSAKGRIVERLSVHHFGREGVLLLAGVGAAVPILEHLRKYTFAERTELTDVTDATAAFALVGPKWRDASRAAGLPSVPAYGAVVTMLDTARVRVLGTNGFDDDGILVVGAKEHAGTIETILTAAVESVGGAAMTADDVEAWRVVRGLPDRGAELDDEHNPLEAGLKDAVSFTKGCYVGQEVVARLNTYGKVSRRLIRLELSRGAAAPARGAPVRHDGREIGAITSAVNHPGLGAAVALAYVKARELPAGSTTLTVDDGSPAGAAAEIKER
jgi:folate-binding protein YgfZ